MLVVFGSPYTVPDRLKPRLQQNLLPNGSVLVAGGGLGTFSANRLASSELYNPVAGTFSVAATMSTPRFGHTATLLADGTVLIAGGGDAYNSATRAAEIYHPAGGPAPLGRRAP